MPQNVRPPRLRPGDEVRVIAPSRSRAMVNEFDHSALIERRLRDLGLRVTYGEHVDERDEFDSSPIASRVADFHDAFSDSSVAGILTVIGGFNANELLPYLDWELIAQNPKVFCGYSDITVLQNAMLAKAGLITYSGPHWSSFGMRDHFEQTLDWFTRAVLDDDSFDPTPSSTWTDDAWFMDQDSRDLLPTDGWWRLRHGEAFGALIGGNLCTLNLLQGTGWMPSVRDAVLFVEDDELSGSLTFARDLTSLLQAIDPAQVRGLLIGRFQRSSRVARSDIEQIIARQPLAVDVPILANVDFGHTNPQLTLPVGGSVTLSVDERSARLTIGRH